jgi:hypothetical protein
MCTPGRRTSLAAWQEKLQSGGDVRQYCEELMAFWCEVRNRPNRPTSTDVRTQIGGLRAAAGGRAAFAAGQDARDTYGSARRAAIAFQLSVGTACRRADQQVRSSAAC